LKARHTPYALVSLAILLTSLLAASPARAIVPAVLVTDPGDSGPGTLRATIASSSAGEVVVIADGVNPTLTTGEIPITHAVTIEGQGIGATTISAGHASRIFDISGPSTTSVTISDLTMTGGRAPTGVPPNNNGGAITNAAALTLDQVEIADSLAGNGTSQVITAGNAGGNGGGIYSLGSLTVLDSIFTGNVAGPGGESTAAAGGKGGDGGGIAFGPGINLDIDRTTISDNIAGAGGFSTNAVGGPGGAGGGLATEGVANFHLIASTVEGNRSGNGTTGPDPGSNNGGNGGGIYGDGTVLNSTISGNKTGDGGSPTGVTGQGAGVYINFYGELASSTVTGNSVGASHSATIPGGGVVGGTVRNSIISGNESNECLGVTDGGHNLGADPTCPAGFSDANPGFDPAGLASNGGPTETVALLPGSAALDGVPAPDCVDLAGGNPPLTFDQRGLPRPAGPACDIGAFELQLSPALPGPGPAASTPGSTRRTKKCKKRKRRASAAKRKCKRQTR
jgi:hypothetical protein